MPSARHMFAEALPAVSIVSLKSLHKAELTPHSVAEILGVELATSEPPFGGVRYWLKCPLCGRRCGVLYYRDRYACRRCNRVVYESQYDRPAIRQSARTFLLMLRLEALKQRPRLASKRKFERQRLATMVKLAKMIDISLP